MLSQVSYLPVGRVFPAMLPQTVGVFVDLATVHALVDIGRIVVSLCVLLGCTILSKTGSAS